MLTRQKVCGRYVVVVCDSLKIYGMGILLMQYKLKVFLHLKTNILSYARHQLIVEEMSVLFCLILNGLRIKRKVSN